MVAQLNILTWPNRISKSAIRAHLTIMGEPVSKQRPKFAVGKSGKAYTPKGTKEAQEAIAWQIKAAHQALMPDSDSTFGVRLLFHQASHQRRDIDNMIKLVFDACTGIVWADDSQVLEITSRIFRGVPSAKTEICIYRLLMPNLEYKTCPACGKQFRSYPSWRYTKRYCSTTCSKAATRTGHIINCTHCGKEMYRATYRLSTKEAYCCRECFDAHRIMEFQCDYCQKTFYRPRSLNKSGRKFCSKECQAASWREHRTKQARGVCIDCSGPTTKKIYKRCMACQITSNRFRSPGAKPK